MAETASKLRDVLRSGCSTLGINLTSQQETALLNYLELLDKWNRTYNLSAVRDIEQMVVRHILDSIAVAEHVSGSRVADVGTGAGLPGVPLAIVKPQVQFSLLDSNGKKTRFLFQVKRALGLDNMHVHKQRVQDFQPAEPVDAITSRAFASLSDMVAACGHMLASKGRFLAMKGSYPEQELAVLSSRYRVLAVHSLAVPGLDEQRHLVEIAARNEGKDVDIGEAESCRG
ncbi:MAG: 16S rRNA (guanine(527)-N(7))-methyltransferase RsmG [Pseudomonadota bacterium]